MTPSLLSPPAAPPSALSVHMAPCDMAPVVMALEQIRMALAHDADGVLMHGAARLLGRLQAPGDAAGLVQVAVTGTVPSPLGLLVNSQARPAGDLLALLAHAHVLLEGPGC